MKLTKHELMVMCFLATDKSEAWKRKHQELFTKLRSVCLDELTKIDHAIKKGWGDHLNKCGYHKQTILNFLKKMKQTVEVKETIQEFEKDTYPSSKRYFFQSRDEDFLLIWNPTDKDYEFDLIGISNKWRGSTRCFPSPMNYLDMINSYLFPAIVYIISDFSGMKVLGIKREKYLKALEGLEE